MGKKSKSSHGKQKREQKLLREATKQKYLELVSRTSSVPDVLVDFAPFRQFDKDGLSLAITYLASCDLTDEAKDVIYTLFLDNMKEDYEAAGWPYDRETKGAELFDKDARYLLVRSNDGDLVAYAHIRFMLNEDEDSPVVYLYEIQLRETVQRLGLGKRIMQLVELIGMKYGMEAVMLTVFKQNTAAFNFYINRMRYAVDETSPSQCGEDDETYEILVKPLKRRV